MRPEPTKLIIPVDAANADDEEAAVVVGSAPVGASVASQAVITTITTTSQERRDLIGRHDRTRRNRPLLPLGCHSYRAQ
jgi:hypothetical protein